MAIKRIYIVEGRYPAHRTTGERWLVAAFNTRKEANKLAVEMNRLCRVINISPDLREGPNPTAQEYETAQKRLKIHDQKFRKRYETGYFVVSVRSRLK